MFIWQWNSGSLNYGVSEILPINFWNHELENLPIEKHAINNKFLERKCPWTYELRYIVSLNLNALRTEFLNWEKCMHHSRMYYVRGEAAVLDSVLLLFPLWITFVCLYEIPLRKEPEPSKEAVDFQLDMPEAKAWGGRRWGQDAHTVRIMGNRTKPSSLLSATWLLPLLAPTFTIAAFSKTQNHAEHEKTWGEAHKWVPVYRGRKSLLNLPQRREGKQDEEKARRKGGRKREEQRERKGVR